MRNNIDARLNDALVRLCLRRQKVLRDLLKQVHSARNRPGGQSGAFTPEQFAIIIALDAYGHGVTVKEITEVIVAPHANVTRTLERLEKKGLVYRKRGTDDRREVIVRLTLEGTNVTRSMRDVERKLTIALWGRLSDDEKARLLTLLTR